MLDNAAATLVAKGIISPRDEKLLADRSDIEAIDDSLAFNIQGNASISNMAQCQRVIGNEVRALSTSIHRL
jgi:hypothetical protein